MADTASLASPAIRQFNAAYVQDLLLEYPDIAGFRVDWPEYPCYTWAELFSDFSPHVSTWAAHGFDMAAIQRDVQALKTFLDRDLTDEHLAMLDAPDRGATVLWSAALARPGITECPSQANQGTGNNVVYLRSIE